MNAMESKITPEILNACDSYSHSPIYHALAGAVAKNDLTNAAFVSEEARRLSFRFSLDLKTMEATDQKASGRCWLFAGLNLLREAVAKEKGIKDFELSQNYLAFWDKFEKINYMLECVLETADVDTGNRTFTWLMQTGVQDGGQWDMFVSLIEKYGAIPKDAMPETFHSSNTGMMNRLLNARLRVCSAQLRTLHRQGQSMVQLRQEKEEMLKGFYASLCMCFSRPPERFDFEYSDADGGFHIEKGLTPNEFADKYLLDCIQDTVSIIHAPTADKPFGRTYTVRFLGNVAGGRPVTYLNLDWPDFQALILRQLQGGDLVWFGSDVSLYGDRESGVWDDRSYDYEALLQTGLTMEKGDALCYRESCMNHAMVLCGVNLDEQGQPDRWKIENSWGAEKGKKGYFMASQSWFERFAYQAVIQKKYLLEEQLQALEMQPSVLEPWDPMGSLAD